MADLKKEGELEGTNNKDNMSVVAEETRGTAAATTNALADKPEPAEAPEPVAEPEPETNTLPNAVIPDWGLVGVGSDNIVIPRKCFTCGLEEHSETCNERFYICSHCNQSGHLFGNCPQLAQVGPLRDEEIAALFMSPANLGSFAW